MENDYEKFSHFKELGYISGESFFSNTRGWKSSINQDKRFTYEMCKNNLGKKNFQLDISCEINHLILSKKAIALFASYGEIFPIFTESKKKSFFGFYPNKSVLDKDVINLKLSDYDVDIQGNYNWGRIIFNKNIEKSGMDFFVIDEKMSSFYVTEGFKESLYHHNLNGVEFVLEYDSDLPSDWKFEIIKSNLDNPVWGFFIREAYGFGGALKDFEEIVFDKDVVEEQPYLKIYEDYKDYLSISSEIYPNLSQYDVLCISNRELGDAVKKLNLFTRFLSEYKIFLKRKYIALCPSIEVFDDGVMINGRFIKGLTVID